MAPYDADTWLYLFRRSTPLQMRLHETLRAMGKTEGLMGLDVGAPNGALSLCLRKQGGDWESAQFTAEASGAVQTVVGTPVHTLDKRTLPFQPKAFDVIVIFDGLKGFSEDEAFIEECHRVLKPDGRLVVNVAHQKPVSFLQPFRALFQRGSGSWDREGAGYTESQLFSILKHGFDVHHVRSYSRLLSESVDLVVQFWAARIAPEDVDADRRLRRIYSVGGVFYWLAGQLDLLLFFTRGYRLVASAKRRAWRPRRAPVLVDGRSISEAVLSKAAD